MHTTMRQAWRSWSRPSRNSLTTPPSRLPWRVACTTWTGSGVSPWFGYFLHLPELTLVAAPACSRAVAALLKETAKAGLPHRALELFDWLRGLPPSNDLSVLCDVFTYTTGLF